MSDIKTPPMPSLRRPPDGPMPARAPLPRGRVTGSRHSVITRNLQNYANYKSWAEKMRSSWVPGKDPET
jgi:hypothetical protein